MVLFLMKLASAEANKIFLQINVVVIIPVVLRIYPVAHGFHKIMHQMARNQAYIKLLVSGPKDFLCLIDSVPERLYIVCSRSGKGKGHKIYLFILPYVSPSRYAKVLSYNLPAEMVSVSPYIIGEKSMA